MLPREVQLIWSLACEGRIKRTNLGSLAIPTVIRYIETQVLKYAGQEGDNAAEGTNTTSLRFVSYLIYGMSLLIFHQSVELLRNSRSVVAYCGSIISNTPEMIYQHKVRASTTLPKDPGFALDFALKDLDLPFLGAPQNADGSFLVSTDVKDPSSELTSTSVVKSEYGSKTAEYYSGGFADSIDYEDVGNQNNNQDNSNVHSQYSNSVVVPDSLWPDHPPSLGRENEHQSTTFSHRSTPLCDAVISHVQSSAIKESEAPHLAILRVPRDSNTNADPDVFRRLPLKRKLVPNSVTELSNDQLVLRDQQYCMNMISKRVKSLFSKSATKPQSALVELLRPFGVDHHDIFKYDSANNNRETGFSSPESIELQRHASSTNTRTSYAASSATHGGSNNLHLNLRSSATPSILHSGATTRSNIASRMSLIRDRNSSSLGGFGAQNTEDFDGGFEFHSYDDDFYENQGLEENAQSFASTIDADRIHSVKLLEKIPTEQPVDVLQFSVVTYAGYDAPETLQAHIAKTFYHLLILAQLQEVKLEQDTNKRVRLQKC